LKQHLFLSIIFLLYSTYEIHMQLIFLINKIQLICHVTSLHPLKKKKMMMTMMIIIIQNTNCPTTTHMNTAEIIKMFIAIK